MQGGIVKTLHESHVTKSGAVVDTLVWQGLASVVVPGFTINRACALTRLLLRQRVIQRQMAMSPALQRWTVTAVGLGCIPFIIQPIDRSVYVCTASYKFNSVFRVHYRLVDRFMDRFGRPFLKNFLP